jgi:hypothetical protein
VNSELLRDPLVIAGLAIGLGMKALDMVKTARHRSAQMNGENPVVLALHEEGKRNREDAAEREARKSAQLASHEACCNQRMHDHQAQMVQYIDMAIAASKRPHVG